MDAISYPFTPADATLWTNQRWKTRKTIRIGATSMTPKAKIWPQSYGGCPWKTAISSGSGRTCGSSTISTGQRNELQDVRNVRRLTVAWTGVDIGTTTSREVFHGQAASPR